MKTERGYEIWAKVKTKSNYRGLNNSWLKVLELAGRRVSVQHNSNEFQKTITIDFTLDEVIEFKMGKQETNK